MAQIEKRLRNKLLGHKREAKTLSVEGDAPSDVTPRPGDGTFTYRVVAEEGQSVTIDLGHPADDWGLDENELLRLTFIISAGPEAEVAVFGTADPYTAGGDPVPTLYGPFNLVHVCGVHDPGQDDWAWLVETQGTPFEPQGTGTDPA